MYVQGLMTGQLTRGLAGAAVCLHCSRLVCWLVINLHSILIRQRQACSCLERAAASQPLCQPCP